MDFNTTLDIIINDLKEAREIIDDLKNYPGVPRLQIELAKSKCRNAEEIISLLKTIELAGEAEPQEKPLPHAANDPVIEKPAETIPEITEEIKTVPEELVFEEEEPRVNTDQIPEKKIKDKKPENPIIADRFSKVSNIVDEQLGTHKRDDDISSLLKTRHVDNLKDAIGINDKFLYIRELFDGNQTLYQEAITKLNDAESYDDARSVLFSYMDEDEENELVIQLLDLVKRKLRADG